MANKKQETIGFDEFLAEYKAAEIPKGKHINSSKYTLDQQLKRFKKFSHSREECEKIVKDSSGI